MEWLLLRRRRLLLEQQVRIELPRLLHHLLLHTQRPTLQTDKGTERDGGPCAKLPRGLLLVCIRFLVGGRWAIMLGQLAQLLGKQQPSSREFW